MNHELRDNEKLRERLGDVMGGKVLELPSDELRRAEARGREEGYRQGNVQGIMQGNIKGIERLNDLIARLNEQGRLDDLIKSISDSDYQEQLFREFGI